MVWRAAIVYFAVVFAAAFVLGVVRVLVVTPNVGALAAVALEVPIVLALSWLVAGRILRRWPMQLHRRVAMGTLAFVILMLAEGVLSGLLFGQTARDFAGAMGTLPGAVGLAGQIGFAVIPVLRR
jgi:hypothetical protein